MDNKTKPQERASPSEGRIRVMWAAIKEPRKQILFMLWACDIHHAMQQIYEKRYEKPGLSRSHSPDEKRVWHWAGFPDLWPPLVWYHKLETIYLVYMLFKQILFGPLQMMIEFLFKPKLPSNCYLPGRMVVDEQSERFLTVVYSFNLVIWRYFQRKRYNQLDMSLVYFFMLDDRDIQKYYEVLSIETNSRINNYDPASLYLPYSERTRLLKRRDLWSALTGKKITTMTESKMMDNYRLRMLHDIMSYRLDYSRGVTFKIRPNRVPEARARLQSIMAVMLTLCAPGLVVAFLLSLIVIVFVGMKARRIMNNYPGCNPDLERMVFNGEMPPDSIYFLGERTIMTFPYDFVETLILWNECGITCTIAPVLMHLLQEDLLIYSSHIHAKIKHVLEEVKNMHAPQEILAETGKNSIARRKFCTQRLDQLVFDVQMQMQDMVLQIKQVDQFVTDCMTGFLYHWFALHGYFVYRRHTGQKNWLIPVMKLVLTFFAILMSLQCILLLRVHSRAHKLYPLICSLMAYDRSKYKIRFGAIIEYFVLKRTCFTLFRIKKMTAAFYITLLGWVCSWHFILSNIISEAVR